MSPAATHVAPHAVIVGVGPGLGASLARTFARAGYDLTLVARRPASIHPVAEQVEGLGRVAREEVADVSDLESVRSVVQRANDWRAVSLLHHNASMNAGGLLDADISTLRASVGVNVLAPVVAGQAALPGLTVTGGRVTWTGGGLALKPHPDYGVLSVGKAALRAAALALGPELSDRGVDLRLLTITGVIHPGTAFDPDRIAAAFWAFAQESEGEFERIFDGGQ